MTVKKKHTLTHISHNPPTHSTITALLGTFVSKSPLKPDPKGAHKALAQRATTAR